MPCSKNNNVANNKKLYLLQQSAVLSHCELSDIIPTKKKLI